MRGVALRSAGPLNLSVDADSTRGHDCAGPGPRRRRRRVMLAQVARAGRIVLVLLASPAGPSCCRGPARRPEPVLRRRIVRFARHGYWLSLMTFVVHDRVEVLLLGALATTEVVSFYSVALGAAEAAMGLGPYIISAIFFPLLAAAWSGSDRAGVFAPLRAVPALHDVRGRPAGAGRRRRGRGRRRGRLRTGLRADGAGAAHHAPLGGGRGPGAGADRRLGGRRAAGLAVARARPAGGSPTSARLRAGPAVRRRSARPGPIWSSPWPRCSCWGWSPGGWPARCRRPAAACRSSRPGSPRWPRRWRSATGDRSGWRSACWWRCPSTSVRWWSAGFSARTTPRSSRRSWRGCGCPVGSAGPDRARRA